MTDPRTENEQVKVTARVRVVLDIPLTQPWDKQCPLEQLFEQARQQAIGIVQRWNGHQGMRLVEEPVVTAVLVPENAR